MKRENAVATVDREQQVIQRMRGGGGNDTGPTLSGSGSPREWPVCASFSDDLNNGCYMSKNGGSEFLNRDCYDPNDAENPKLRCDACKKPLHSALCAPSHSEDRAKLICKLCVATAMATAAAAKVAKASAASRSRSNKRSSTTTPATNQQEAIVAGPAAASASASASTSTSTSGTRKNDAKALYAWIVNASVGNSLRFTVGSTVGSTRRKNMDILVKNLIDTNTGLSFTENLSGRILTIKIRSKPSSAVIVPAVEDKPPKWRKSEAKEYLIKELMRGDSWIDLLIAIDEGNNIAWSQTAKLIQKEEPLFRQYDPTHFSSNLLRLVESVRKDRGRGEWEQDALNKEKLKYPINAVLIQGYPRWNISSTKKLLEEDIKAKKNVGVLPRDLRVTRQEYIDFPLRIFRDRLYAEVRKQAGDAFWVHKRNKKMMKQKVANDNENDEIATNE